MELGTIKRINIDAEMQASYLDYAMSVIVARALPDVRDGLKPVHRRILYAMYDLGLRPDQPYKKSARIVGEVLGKYHPHGDAAVYEAMVRMAQDFSLRYPLVDGQGNFGSIDGDNAAAMRYTEARLSRIAMEMLNDIEKDTVEWGDNFDGTLKEPLVLPAALPNLVVNGSSGIAVGMSTNIPPHNLGETCDALCYLIDNYDKREDVTIEDLMKFIPGPDFPTGGVVFRYGAPGQEGERVDLIAQAYASGRGQVTMQARAHIEEMSRNRSRIVVTELPYGANKSNIVERIAELAREGRIEGLTDLRDESDRTGMRLCIEMTRTVEPRDVLAMLYKYTPLQQTFGMSLLALVDGEPKLLSLKRMLLHFLEHRQEVILRRAKHDLKKARQRAHILEGLLKALDILDEVIALIRGSRTADIARQGLIKQFGFTEIQAQAILDMQLRRLAALERKKLQDEYREIVALIKELEALIASPKKVLALIRQNLVDLKATYGDARRTQITDQARGALTVHDVLPEEDVWVTVRANGTVGRAAQRLPAGTAAPRFILEANTHCDLYLISRKGQATRIGVHQLPDGAGAPHADLGGLRRSDEIAAAFTAAKPNGEPVEGYLVLATARGAIKRVNLADLAAAAQANPNVIKLDENDSLAWAATSSGGGEILLVTAGGQVIRFAEDEVRPMGLPAGGIAGIKLQGDDRVVGGAVVNAETGGREVALLTSAGYGRRSPLADFPAKGRGTQGVGAKLAAKSGPIVSSLLVKPTDKLLVTVSQGEPKPLAAKAIPRAARTAAGKVVLVLGAEQALGAVVVPEGGVAPVGPKTNGPALAEKPKRSSKKAETQAEPVPASKTKTSAKRAEPATPKSRASTETTEPAVAKAKTPAAQADPPAPKTRASTAKAGPTVAKVEAPKPPVEPAAQKTKASTPKAGAPDAKTRAMPAKAGAGVAREAPAKTKAAAAKDEPASTKAAGQAAAEKPARSKKSAAPATAAPVSAPPPAPLAKDPGPAAAPTATRGKKPAELPRAPGPNEDVVSHRGKPGVIARPTVTDTGQMLLVPPDPPPDTAPKKPRKGTAK